MSYFICGITGTQGAAVAKQLLQHGATVHGLARDTTSAKSVAMAKLGASLFPGDYHSPALKDAMKGCVGAFLNFSPSHIDPTWELNTAKLVAETALAAGVKHVVYTSSPATDNPEKFSNWDKDNFTAKVILSKRAIEELVRGAGFGSWAVLRPASFMSNFLQPLVKMYDGLVEKGVWTTALRSDSILPLVDPVTIGTFGADALLDPKRFAGHSIELADEFLLPQEALDKLSAATGRNLQLAPLSEEEVQAQKATNPFVAGMYLMRELHRFVDLEEVKGWGIPVSSMDAFLEREKEALLETYKQN